MTSTPERTGAAGEKARGYPRTVAAGREYWRASGLDAELRALNARISRYRGGRRVDTLRLQAELNSTLFELEQTEGRLRECLLELGAHSDRSADAHAAALRRLDAVCRLSGLLVGELAEGETVLLERATRLLAEEFAAQVSVFLEADPATADGTLHEAATAQGRRESGTDDGGSGADEGAGQGRGPAAAAMDAALRIHRIGRPLLQRHDPGPPGPSSSSPGPSAGPVTSGAAPAHGALLGVPLQAGGRMLGSLVMLRAEDFAIQELGLVEELSRQLALALGSERGRLREAGAAQVLQSSLLPSALPPVPGVQVAGSYTAPRGGGAVGGDFYDVFPVRDGWGLLLGDVCGKGEEAAAVTAVVRHGTRALSVGEQCPEEVLEKVGQVMALQNTSDRFATAVFACLRPEPTCGPGAVRLSVASAGHLPAAVVRARGEVSFLKGGGCPLGITGLSEVSVEEVVLQAGDALLLYSDGATEARDANGVFFDERGLAAVLAETEGMSAEAMVWAIEQRVQGFAGGAPQDDMALLAVRVEPHAVAADDGPP